VVGGVRYVTDRLSGNSHQAQEAVGLLPVTDNTTTFTSDELQTFAKRTSSNQWPGREKRSDVQGGDGKWLF